MTNTLPEFLNSRPVVISSYKPSWSVDFCEIAQRIRKIIGDAALRIDHVGSTAVPGLGAKDVIDIQITVADLDETEELTRPLRAVGFRQGTEFIYDIFHQFSETDPGLRKLYMREPEGERRAHIHIRELGRFNQRYALLFRDYLRTSREVSAEYELFKRRAAQLFPNSIDGYLYLKDPMLHIIYEAAAGWARHVNWSPANDFA